MVSPATVTLDCNDCTIWLWNSFLENEPGEENEELHIRICTPGHLVRCCCGRRRRQGAARRSRLLPHRRLAARSNQCIKVQGHRHQCLRRPEAGANGETTRRTETTRH